MFWNICIPNRVCMCAAFFSTFHLLNISAVSNEIIRCESFPFGWRWFQNWKVTDPAAVRIPTPGIVTQLETVKAITNFLRNLYTMYKIPCDWQSWERHAREGTFSGEKTRSHLWEWVGKLGVGVYNYTLSSGVCNYSSIALVLTRLYWRSLDTWGVLVINLCCGEGG